jgi:hypothetical protein
MLGGVNAMAARFFRGCIAALAAAAVTTSAARAAANDDDQSGFFGAIRSGRDLIRSAPAVAALDGGWTLAMNYAWALSANSVRPINVQSVTSFASTHILYGTSWSLMLASEALLARAAFGTGWRWLERADWRSDWMFGGDVPAGCGTLGRQGGCGLGLGGFSGIRYKVAELTWPVTFEASGGWLQGRVVSDARRTVIESIWIMTPFAASYDARVTAGPLEVKASLGPGVYFGMHNGHVHPTVLGARASSERVHASWTGIVPLEAGLGPGGNAALSVAAFGVALEAEAIVAPFVAGYVDQHPDAAIAPLDAPRAGGIPVWRRASLGLSVPLAGGGRVGLHAWAAELSTRALSELGHRALVVRFDLPLRTDIGGH